MNYNEQSDAPYFSAYTSVKVVRAAEITHIYSPGCVGLGPDKRSFVFTPAGKPTPQVGWLAICYPDGYISFSPPETFRDGYVAGHAESGVDRTHVYAGKPDARQLDTASPAKLFRKRYRKLEPDTMALHDAIKEKADELAELFARVQAGLPKSASSGFLSNLADNQTATVVLALRHLEDAVYRAVKALTA